MRRLKNYLDKLFNKNKISNVISKKHPQNGLLNIVGILLFDMSVDV
jgi:hypothetical protein